MTLRWSNLWFCPMGWNFDWSNMQKRPFSNFLSVVFQICKSLSLLAWNIPTSSPSICSFSMFGFFQKYVVAYFINRLCAPLVENIAFLLCLLFIFHWSNNFPPYYEWLQLIRRNLLRKVLEKILGKFSKKIESIGTELLWWMKKVF